MKISPSGFFSGAFTAIATILLGFFLIINVLVVSFYAIEAYDNYQEYKARGPMVEGRIHTFLGMDSTDTIQSCDALVYDGNIIVRDYGPEKSGYCTNVFSKSNLMNWEKHAVNGPKRSVADNGLWTMILVGVTGVAAIILGGVAAKFVAIVFPQIEIFCMLVLMPLFAAPLWVFWGAVAVAGWTHHPSHWESPDGRSVDTRKVFVSRDRTMYVAPNDLIDWTKSQTMNKVGKIE